MPHGADPFLESDSEPMNHDEQPLIARDPQRVPAAVTSTAPTPRNEPPVRTPEIPASPAQGSPPPAEVAVEPSTLSNASVGSEPDVLTEISQERDFLKARVDELSQTGRALESAQTGQAQEAELLRRQVEALQAGSSAVC